MRGTCTGSSPGAIGLGGSRSARQARFAHKSERHFARVLDFYRLRWEYEPHTYPLEWDAAGAAVESFTPDFYLDRKSTRLNSSHIQKSRMPSSA